MANITGNQGFAIGSRAQAYKTPSALGFVFTTRDTIDPAGARGFVFGTNANALLNLRPTNFGVITQPLTVSMSWAGHAAEVYLYSPDFVKRRQFPLNTLITFQTSGAAYVTTTTTATLTSSLPTALDVPVTLTSSLNAYRRRRYL